MEGPFPRKFVTCWRLETSLNEMQLHIIQSLLIKVMPVYLNSPQKCCTCSRFTFTERSSSLFHSLHRENSLIPECLSEFHFPHAASDNSLLPNILSILSGHLCPDKSLLQGTYPDLVLYSFSTWNFSHVPFPGTFHMSCKPFQSSYALPLDWSTYTPHWIVISAFSYVLWHLRCFPDWCCNLTEQGKSPLQVFSLHLHLWCTSAQNGQLKTMKETAERWQKHLEKGQIKILVTSKCSAVTWVT